MSVFTILGIVFGSVFAYAIAAGVVAGRYWALHEGKKASPSKDPVIFVGIFWPFVLLFHFLIQRPYHWAVSLEKKAEVPEAKVVR